MNLLLLVLGALLVAAALLDVVWTVLWADGGAGPLSSRLSSWLWRAQRRLGRQRSTVVSLAGPVVLLATLVTWIGLLWLGWTLLFAGGGQTLYDSLGMDDEVSWPQRFYFVAYSMSTMGNGDLKPVGGVWQIATALTTLSGMLVLTMGVTYLLQILGAVAQKRSFASSVHGYGRSGADIVRHGWDGKDLRSLDLPLSTLATQVSSLADQHKAYPILHYYHSQQAEDAPARAVANLDEALTLMERGVPDSGLYNAAIVRSARSSVAGYLSTLRGAYLSAADEAPPAPDLAALRRDGIPTVDDATFARALEDLDERRRALLGVVRGDDWQWPQEAS